MSAKKISTLVLSIFILAAVIMMVSKIISDKDDAIESTSELPDNADVVYFFHGDIRCVTCEMIEKLTTESVNENFHERLDEGTLILKTYNYDKPENEHFVEKYDLYTSSVVLVKIRNSKEESWKNLEDVWSYVDDEIELKAFIADEVKIFFEGN